MLVIFQSVLAADTILLKIVSQKELSLEAYGLSRISPRGWREPSLGYNYTEHFFPPTPHFIQEKVDIQGI